jgi:hypothetical protein
MNGPLGLLVEIWAVANIPRGLHPPPGHVLAGAGNLGFAWLGLLPIGGYVLRRLTGRRVRRTPFVQVRPTAVLPQVAPRGIVVRVARPQVNHGLTTIARAPARPGRRTYRPPSLRPSRPAQPAGDAAPDLEATLAGKGRPRARQPIPAGLRFAVLARDGFRCRYCGCTASEPGVVLQLDHVVPVAAGGATSEDNLVAACADCNLGKSKRLLEPTGSS